MRTQAKVALEKEKHPERFCKIHRCLWKVVQLDHATQTFHPRPDCPDGFCPRHRPVTLRSPLLGPSQYDRRQQERESQTSKHCDAGAMNDMRFGDGGE